MAEDMADLVQAAAEGRRSALHTWMYKNHRRFARDVLAAAGKPNWDALAIEFARRGMGAKEGTKQPGEAARKVWMAVRARLEREAKAKAQPARISGAAPYSMAPAPDPLDDVDFPDIDRIS